ncbi:hypothetical protein [Anaplasma marginale]|uniref:hypothetical protein n=1 Tax=Anaplasma marginale TaxID=770 RepID=UPI0001B4661B|nr:hypothetical protein [Anaplasma marginale]
MFRGRTVMMPKLRFLLIAGVSALGTARCSGGTKSFGCVGSVVMPGLSITEVDPIALTSITSATMALSSLLRLARALSHLPLFCSPIDSIINRTWVDALVVPGTASG